MYWKIPPDSKVHLPRAEASRKVARRIARRSGSWIRECSRVNRSAPRELRTVQIKRNARNDIQSPLERLPSGGVHYRRAVQSHWKCRSSREATIQSPMIQQCTGKAGFKVVRQIVRERCRQIMPNVKVAVSSSIWKSEVIRPVIDGVTPRVRSQGCQPMRYPSLVLPLKGMVVGAEPILNKHDSLKIRIDGIDIHLIV